MRPIHLTLSHPIPKEDPMTEFAQLNRATGEFSERPQAKAVEDWDWSE